MTRRSVVPFLLVALLALGSTQPAVAGAADVHVGINIGVPPAPPVVALPAPPQLAVVPGMPVVEYAPGVPFNLFTYGTQYYTFHDGAWFWARTYGEPWVYVPRERVPHTVLAVPVRYYRIPPGHWKKMHGHPHGGHHGEDEWFEEHGRGHGHHKHGHDD
jgi:hypothetical protein